MISNSNSSQFSLLNLKNDEWGDKVEIIASDMRDWRPTEKADILVSELLGSIGDNELSPECLDGAQSFLKGFPLIKFIFWSNLKFIKRCIFIL